MRRGSRRLPEDERADRGEHPAESAPEPPVLALQRSAGNAAVTRLLAREPAPAFSPIRPDAPVQTPSLVGSSAVSASILADWEAGTQAVRDWFDKAAEPFREGGSIPLSVPELVFQASQQPFTLKDGGNAFVRDKVKPAEVEGQIRLRAKTQGIRLTEHRDMSDVAGVRSELGSVLANMGALPTQITFGDHDAKIVASISGKVTGEAKVGGAKVEGEVSGEGVKGSVSGPGAKFGLGVDDKGIKAEVKAGELLTVNGSITREAAGVVAWKAEVSIGTIGKLIMPEDVAKVFKGAQDTFSKSAGELARNLDDPAKVKEHGGALAGAVGDVVEKAKKSATQKSGWRVGGELKGDSAGGFSGTVTFTWVF